MEVQKKEQLAHKKLPDENPLLWSKGQTQSWLSSLPVRSKTTAYESYQKRVTDGGALLSISADEIKTMFKDPEDKIIFETNIANLKNKARDLANAVQSKKQGEVILRVEYQGRVKVWKADFQRFTYSRLVEKVNASFFNVTFNLVYIDTDNDRLIIDSEVSFDYALRDAEHRYLRLKLERTEDLTTQDTKLMEIALKPVLVWRRRDGKILYLNSKCERLLDYKKRQTEGKIVYNIVFEGDVEKLRRLVNSRWKKTVTEIEVKMVKGCGGIIKTNFSMMRKKINVKLGSLVIAFVNCIEDL